MIQPQAWKVFGSHIHQDFLLDYPGFFEGLGMVYKCLKEPEQRAVLAYVTQLANENIDASVKAKAWDESGSEILVSVSQVDEFLLLVLAALKAAESERAGARGQAGERGHDSQENPGSGRALPHAPA